MNKVQATTVETLKTLLGIFGTLGGVVAVLCFWAFEQALITETTFMVVGSVALLCDALVTAARASVGKDHPIVEAYDKANKVKTVYITGETGNGRNREEGNSGSSV